MFQSHEVPSFSGFFSPVGGLINSECESIMFMPEAELGDQHRGQFYARDASMRCLFPQSNEELSLSVGAKIQQQTFVQKPHYSRSQMQNMEFLGEENIISHERELCNVRISKYLNPTRKLLQEICNGGADAGAREKLQRNWMKAGYGTRSSSSLITCSLQKMDIVELHKKKAYLITLLEEVDKRYKRYCNNMTAVARAFEEAAGMGTAEPYMALTSKAMSRHFRRVRDGIVEQLLAMKKVIGEKDTLAVPGMSRGETPRLKLLHQCFKKKSTVFQDGNNGDAQPWKPNRGLPERAISTLRAWLFEHFLHPYPSDIDKHILARLTGLSISQVSNWFINARVRLWKPLIEELYMEEIKGRGNQMAAYKNPKSNPNINNPNRNRLHGNDYQRKNRKPDSLSSIFNNNEGHRSDQYGFFCFSGLLGIENFSESTAEVNLTLGLQQDEGGNLGFSFQNEQHLF